jgi:hypothetical protein
LFLFEGGILIDKRKMSRDIVEIMDGMENVRDNRQFVMVEILILSALIGYYVHSWPAFFGAIIVLAILFVIPVLRLVIFGLLSVIWGGIAYVILGFFLTGGLPIVGGVLIAILIFFIHKGTS